MSDESSHPGVIDAIARDRCADCGYRLVGLPEGTPCPECGAAPNPNEMVLYGSCSNDVRLRTFWGELYRILIGLCIWIALVQIFWSFGYRSNLTIIFYLVGMVVVFALIPTQKKIEREEERRICWSDATKIVLKGILTSQWIWKSRLQVVAPRSSADSRN